MFSRSKGDGQGQTPQQPSKQQDVKDYSTPPKPAASTSSSDSSASSAPAPAAPKSKAAASLLSSDITIEGNISSTGDINIEGVIKGDVRANVLTVGENATVHGEVMADDVIVNGRVVGRVRGLKVRLSTSARVEGDIIHKTIAIESGAHFEGSVQRQEDPLKSAGQQAAVSSAASAPQSPKSDS
ncbi:bactofilin family protein [Paracoccaceae bacterium GXU_MW_L88]